MRALLDANVLYPTVLREILIGTARAGLYRPLWSERILREWALAAEKLGPEGAAVARAEIALLRDAWPDAAVAEQPGLERRLWLPDPDDIHVLASAVAGSADLIVTENAQDFPRGTLEEEGLARQSADQFLIGLYDTSPDKVRSVVEEVRVKAESLSGETWPVRRLLKKARLPRLGKRLSA